MKNLNPELAKKARAAKSAEELFEIAKANGVEMTADEANKYYMQITSNELDDDLLDGVAGGYVQETITKGGDADHPDDYKSHC